MTQKLYLRGRSVITNDWILTGLYLSASRYDPNKAACALKKALATPLPVAVDCFFSLLFREDTWWKT